MGMQEKLYATYPDLFEYGINPEPTKHPIAYGIECGEGWQKILENLCENLQKESDKTKEEIKIIQMKEKFGTLRVYVNVHNNSIYKIISEAEKASCVVCEICGKEGELVNSAWLRTLCPKHGEEHI